MKFLKKVLLILIIVLYTITVYSQINFNITKEVIEDSLTLLKVEHPTNGRTAEYLVPLPADEVFFSGLYTNTNDGDETFVSGDKLETTILLPDENGGVPPIEGITNGDEIVVFGGQRFLVLNENFDRVLSKKISNYGYFSPPPPPSYTSSPENKYLERAEGQNKIICATFEGKLIWLDATTYEIVHEEIIPVEFLQSTMIKYDKINDKIFWLVNDWDGNTYFRIYNPDYSYVEEVFSEQINDFDFNPAMQKVYLGGSELTSYDYLLINNYSYSFSARKLICSSFGIIAQPVQIQDIKATIFNDNLEELTILGTTTLATNGTACISFFKDRYLVVQTEGKVSISDYNINFNEWVVLNAESLASLSNIQFDADYFFIGENNSFEKWDETGKLNFLDEYYGSTLITEDEILSLCASSGTISIYQKSTLGYQKIVRTADYVNRGKISRDQNRAFFVTKPTFPYYNSRMYIIDIENNTIINSIDLPYVPVDIESIFIDDEQYFAISSGKIYLYDSSGQLVNQIGLTNIGVPRDDAKMMWGENRSEILVNAVFSVWKVFFTSALSVVVLPIYVNPYWDGDLIIGTDFVVGEEPNWMYTNLVGSEQNDSSILVRFTEPNEIVYSKKILNYRQHSIEFDVDKKKVFLGGVQIKNAHKPVIGSYYFSEEKKYLVGGNYDIPVTNPLQHYLVDLNYSTYQKELYVYSASVGSYSSPNNSSLFIYNPDGMLSIDVGGGLNGCYGFVKDNKKDYSYLGNILSNNLFTLKQMDNLSKKWSGNNVLTGNKIISQITTQYTGGQNLTPIKDLPNQTSKYFYTPNYGFFNISVIEVPKDTKKFLGKIKWLSFPRLYRYSYGNDYVPVKNVLMNFNRYPDFNFNLINSNYDKVEFKGDDNWIFGYNSVNSTEGYKLDYSVPPGKSPDISFIDYQGGKLDPTTSIELHDMSNPQHPSNWVGYFIEYPQKIEEAIPEQSWEHIWIIKAQDWAMYRDETAPYDFIYKGKVRPLEWGDMIEIYSIDDHAFSWNQAGKKDPVPMSKTAHYQYEEKLDYEPVFVLMDKNSDVQEVAIKANGEVIGAAVRETGDTIVQVCAYLEGVDPDTQLELETYSGGKGTNFISDYLVLNKKSKQLEKRKVYAGEKAMYQVVSINPKDEGQLPSPLDQLDVYPVPANESLNISFLMNRSSQLQLTIYNNLGQVIASPLNKSLNKGYYTYQWNLQNQKGKRVPTGIYFYRIDFPEIGISENGKIIVQ